MRAPGAGLLRPPGSPLLVTLVLCATACAQLGEAERAGLRFLLEQQAEDGGWHSEVYGNLRAGPGLTGLIVYACGHLALGEDSLGLAVRAAVERARGFLLARAAEEGLVVAPDGSRDYPYYATAHTLSGLARLGVAVEDSLAAALRAHLHAAQLSERQGWTEDDPDYGGWDFIGGAPGRRTSGSNISLTAAILEAAPPDSGEVRRRALLWAGRMQHADGGFAFTPEAADPSNKAGATDGVALRYGSATCDGLRMLAAFGLPADDPRVAAGLGWLETWGAAFPVPGIAPDGPEVWEHALWYYYGAQLSKALGAWPDSPRARALADTLLPVLREKILTAQRADGSWANEHGAMREDDPLIATSLALISLAEYARKDAE